MWGGLFFEPPSKSLAMKRALFTLFATALLAGTTHAITAVWSGTSISKDTQIKELEIKSVALTFTLSEGASGAIFQLRQGDNQNTAASNRLSLGIDTQGQLVLQMLGKTDNIANQQNAILTEKPTAGKHTLSVTLREEAGKEGQNRYWAYYIFDGGTSTRLQSSTAQTLGAAMDSVTFLSPLPNNPNGLQEATGITVDSFSAYKEMLTDGELKSVPEPTVLAFLALGMAGLAFHRRTF